MNLKVLAAVSQHNVNLNYFKNISFIVLLTFSPLLVFISGCKSDQTKTDTSHNSYETNNYENRYNDQNKIWMDNNSNLNKSYEWPYNNDFNERIVDKEVYQKYQEYLLEQQKARERVIYETPGGTRIEVTPFDKNNPDNGAGIKLVIPID